jgi:hypothetical protein
MCSSCEVLYINGVKCHETGCPEEWKDYLRSCKWCGEDFKPEEKEQDCCCHSCTVAYHNFPCDCVECNPETEEDTDEKEGDISK